MKLPGVESAEVSLDKASADIRLKPDNRITMARLRDVLKKNGYPTREAQVEARGRIVERAGKLFLDLLDESALEIDAGSAPVKVGEQIVQLTGSSRFDPKSGERLTVRSVR